MLNPYVILGFVAVVIGAYGLGRYDGVTIERESHQAQLIAAQKATDAALDVTAKAIASIRVKNTTIRQQAETIIRENTTYAECRHTPDGLQSVNQALKPADTGVVPGTYSADK